MRSLQDEAERESLDGDDHRDDGATDGLSLSPASMHDTPAELLHLRSLDLGLFVDDEKDRKGLLDAALFIMALGSYPGCGAAGGAAADQALRVMKYLRQLATGPYQLGDPDDMATLVAVWRRCTTSLGSFRRTIPSEPRRILADISSGYRLGATAEEAKAEEGALIQREIARLGYEEIGHRGNRSAAR